MIRKLFLCFVVAFFVLPSTFSQSSEKVSTIIAADNATAGQIAYLAGTYTNLVSEDDDYARSFVVMSDAGYFPSRTSVDETVSLLQASYIFAKAVNLKGGLLYSLTGSARYAFKELKAKGILPATSDPDMKISGRDAINIFNECINLSSGE